MYEEPPTHQPLENHLVLKMPADPRPTGSSMILAEFAIAGGTLTIKGVCRYLRNRDNAFKDPGDVQLLGTASKYSANGFQLRISTAESRHLWYVEYR